MKIIDLFGMILTRSFIAQFQVGYIGRFKVDITFDSIFLTFYAAAALDNRRIYGEISIIFSRIEYDHFMFAKKKRRESLLSSECIFSSFRSFRFDSSSITVSLRFPHRVHIAFGCLLLLIHTFKVITIDRKTTNRSFVLCIYKCVMDYSWPKIPYKAKDHSCFLCNFACCSFVLIDVFVFLSSNFPLLLTLCLFFVMHM